MYTPSHEIMLTGLNTLFFLHLFLILRQRDFPLESNLDYFEKFKAMNLISLNDS